MFRIDQFILDQDKHDQYFPKYFHSVERQNRLRLPHIAKTQFFMKTEYRLLLMWAFAKSTFCVITIHTQGLKSFWKIISLYPSINCSGKN